MSTMSPKEFYQTALALVSDAISYCDGADTRHTIGPNDRHLSIQTRRGIGCTSALVRLANDYDPSLVVVPTAAAAKTIQWGYGGVPRLDPKNIIMISDFQKGVGRGMPKNHYNIAFMDGVRHFISRTEHSELIHQLLCYVKIVVEF